MTVRLEFLLVTLMSATTYTVFTKHGNIEAKWTNRKQNNLQLGGICATASHLVLLLT